LVHARRLGPPRSRCKLQLVGAIASVRRRIAKLTSRLQTVQERSDIAEQIEQRGVASQEAKD
ncbi:MAG: hypothetical protein KKE77_05360, partial [Alphaproteobacteria bacterium]|nr:hypothetical protein [Alphaproteobacteria bacterium]